MHYFLAIWMAFFSLLSVSVCANQESALIEGNRLSSELQFTAQELEWIENNKTVTIIGDATWFPFEGFTKEGDYVGIVAEVVSLITKKSGLNFDINETASWRHSIQFSEAQQVDIISASAFNPLIEKNYRATYTTIKSPIVIIARESMSYIPEISAVKGLRIAIIGGAGYGRIIKNAYPEIDFIEVEEISDGLIGVAEEQYDLVLMSMTVASYQMAELGLYELRIAGITDLDMELTLFVNRNKPILWSIIDKVKRHETNQERHQILSNWIKFKYVEPYSPELIRFFIVSVFFLVLFIFYRYYLLKNQKKLFAQLSQTDTLTRKHNRLYLDKIITDQVTQSKGEKNVFSLVIVNVDYFKRVNEKYGHHIGDKFLQQFSLLIEENIDKKAIAGRWGDAEFIIVYPSTNLQQALLLADKLRLDIYHTIFLNVGKKTASLGVVEYVPLESKKECLKRLEKALKGAKKLGTNHVSSEV